MKVNMEYRLSRNRAIIDAHVEPFNILVPRDNIGLRLPQEGYDRVVLCSCQHKEISNMPLRDN